MMFNPSTGETLIPKIKEVVCSHHQKYPDHIFYPNCTCSISYTYEWTITYNREKYNERL